MRLTLPRWTSAVSKSAGNPRDAVVDRIQSFTNHDRKRRDVINPDLCDEALDLLRPSLPPPSSCDIIDINPGAGIWSQQLHQVLKPRRHVFVETEYYNYNTFLAPLLQQPGSVYRLAPHIGDALDENQDFLSPQLRESYTSLNFEAREAASRSLTSQLIITANLAQKNVQSNGFQGAMSKLFLEHFYRNTTMGSGAFPWHKYGLVKLLAWIPDADKLSFSPRCTVHRHRHAKQLEASCQVTEIVSAAPNDGRNSRLRTWHGAGMESVREVATIQSASNIVIPPYRQQPLPKPPASFVQPIEANFPLLKSIESRPRVVDEFIAAYKEAKASDPEWVDEYIDNPKRRGRCSQATGQERSRFARLFIRMKTNHSNYAKVDDLAHAMVHLERRLIAFRRNDPEDIAGYRLFLDILEPRIATIKSKQAALFKDNRHACAKAVDDYRALSPTPHVLCWNNRPFEPLLCHPKKDFYSSNAMSLLEITPRADTVQKLNSSKRQIVFDYLCRILDYRRGESVKDSLEKLVGGDKACDLFVGKFGEPGGIPSLTDPLYGGHHDLSDFRLRNLNFEQLIDIALAYEAWPWRLSLSDMIESVGTSSSASRVM